MQTCFPKGTTKRAFVGSCRRRTPTVCVRAAVNVEQLKALRQELFSYINSRGCNPIIVRLGWHDSGTYDKNIAEWPARGGATGSIRFKPEIDHAANKGLAIALGILGPMKKKFPEVSYADLFQMASAVAVEAAGGPKIPMRYGRKDATSPEQCVPDGRLPGAAHPFADGSTSPAEHLRRVFGRMGLTDQEIVVLSGGHTLGRARPERSGFGADKTKYTDVGPGTSSASPSGSPDRPVTPKPVGQLGTSWTANWLEFDNSYFTEVKAKRDADLLVLPTDACLFEDDGFRPYAEKYAADQEAFFADYALAQQKLSELGVEWDEGAPVTI
ncbi:L-ascorbate peroxidase [Volvox carteri f. nagariensis]|uniref:L-ascorbate peroxidase n=1 Tax=Volvox carteri f. nagariensis TaxID=3068 RepID=D8U4R0_VOLCA|nr:L-ascorbate peroxidase [Volvox carteri f. nagariensis]EFJ45232.1 L-ascorbate peroxidase [Volvox carteri f. nagariensis]|eukprot:XP_002953608.1 L-ascorbate peroxidase [Volvox carteri f. nagariensis]